MMRSLVLEMPVSMSQKKRINRYIDNVANTASALEEYDTRLSNVERYAVYDKSLGDHAFKVTKAGQPTLKKCQNLWMKLYKLGAVDLKAYQPDLAIQYKDNAKETHRIRCSFALKHLSENDFTSDDVRDWLTAKHDRASK